MTETQSQIDWAEQIRPRVDAEFGRVANAFHRVASHQLAADQATTLAIIDILEEKRIRAHRPYVSVVRVQVERTGRTCPWCAFKSSAQAVRVRCARSKMKELAHDEAGYYIKHWQELNDQVRLSIVQDPRYQALKAKRGKHGTH